MRPVTRAISWIVLIVGGTAVLLVTGYVSHQPQVVEWGSGNHLESDRWFVLPLECFNLTWNVSQSEHATLDDQPVPKSGSQRICPSGSQKYTLAVDEAGEQQRHYLYVRVLFSTPNMVVGGLAILVALMAAVFVPALFGDLPWLSARLKPLRTFMVFLPHRILASIKANFTAALGFDFLHISILGLLAAVPLVFLRYVEWEAPGVVYLFLAAALVGVGIHWLRHAPRYSVDQHVTAQSAEPGKHAFRRQFGVLLLLLLCTILGFYVPMQDQFWLGGDEIRTLQDAERGWASIPHYDHLYARPLTPLTTIIATTLVPNAIDGFLWLTFIYRFLSGILVYGTVRLLVPKGELVALAAAFLFIINPSEPTRFVIVHMYAYHATVFFLLLSLYLFLYSARRENRGLLVLSCALLGIALLIVETGFTVALLWPVVLWFAIRQRKQFAVWSYAWLVTVALLAVRLLLFLALSENTYQSSGAFGDRIDPAGWAQNAIMQIGPTFRYFQVFNASWLEWLYAVAVALLVVAGLILFTSNDHRTLPHSHKSFGVAIGISVAGIILGFLPYITIGGLLGTFRTQFVSAPFQAVFWALVIAYIGRFFARSVRGLWVAGTVAIMVLLSTVSSLVWQANRPFNRNVEYDKTVRIIEQVLDIAPRFMPDTALVFVADSDMDTPLGWSYYIWMLSHYAFGVDGFQIGYTDSFGINHEFDASGTSGKYGYPRYPYSQLVAFRIAADSEVTLLEELPEELLPEGAHAADQYNPEARIIQEDPIDPPRFLVDSTN